MVNATRQLSYDGFNDTPDEICPESLHGDTLIMDNEGSLYALEDLAGEYQSTLTVTCIDGHGRLVTSLAHSFRIGHWVDKIYNITFTNGHKIRTTGDYLFLGASGDWIKASELNFGSVLRGATYDPRARNPFLALNEVTHIHMERLNEKIPMYTFSLKNEESLFVAHKTDTGSVSLIVGKAS